MYSQVLKHELNDIQGDSKQRSHSFSSLQTYVCFTLTYCTVCISSKSAGIKKIDFSLINDTYDRAKLALAMIHLALMPTSV